MEYMIGYPVWNKADMIPWLVDGILDNMPSCLVMFFFDDCRDASEKVFASQSQRLLDKGFVVETARSDHEVREIGGHNRLIERFKNSTCEFLIVPQDDQKINYALLNDIIKIRDTYGSKLGVIGGRDGYERGFGKMAGAPHSLSNVTKKLDIGEYIEKPFLNTGPIVYNRKLVELVGNVNDEFIAFYAWDEYCYRANKAGLRNVVLGMDIIHTKFGNIPPSTFYADGIGEHDLKLLRAKCPVW